MNVLFRGNFRAKTPLVPDERKKIRGFGGIARYFLPFLVFSLVSCGTTPTSRNADLVVTYEGQVVHRASPYYKNLKETEALIGQKGLKYVIFSAEACESCRFLRRALDQSGHISTVHALNLQDSWVQRVAMELGVTSIPTMLVVDEKGAIAARFVGPSKIVMHLLINVEVKK